MEKTNRSESAMIQCIKKISALLSSDLLNVLPIPKRAHPSCV